MQQCEMATTQKIPALAVMGYAGIFANTQATGFLINLF